jgi:hypothetical protein
MKRNEDIIGMDHSTICSKYLEILEFIFQYLLTYNNIDYGNKKIKNIMDFWKLINSDDKITLKKILVLKDNKTIMFSLRSQNDIIKNASIFSIGKTMEIKYF